LKTKDLIRETAIRLFNEKGTAAVSTDHIAEACGISPGNLYYHFDSKEDILRAIFERLFALWDAAFDLPAGHQPQLEDVQALVRKNFEIMWAYRFVYRELPALLCREAELKERYVAVRQRGFDGFGQLFAQFAAAGILARAETPQSVTDLAELCWLISEFWLSSVEVSGQAVNALAMERGVNLMMQIVRPYRAA